MLKDKVADVVVTPRDEAEVVRVAAACAKHRIPLTVRGGATGNYGQCVPLEGGVVLDMALLNRIEWQKPGLVRVEAGAKLFDIDAATRPNGFELRMHPSTKRSAQIGGFVAGGSGGVGSVTFGGMREPGNIVAARIVTLEHEPRVIELRGDAAQKISRAYGTTGIITVLEMPLAPAQSWIDVIVAFDDFVDAVRFGHTIAMADGIVKKLLSPIQWPLPQHFAAFRPYCPDGKSLLLGMIGEMSHRKLRDTARGVRRRRSPTRRPARTSSARCRSTSTPGITPRCRCSRPTAASPICNAFIRTTALPMRWRRLTRNSATKSVSISSSSG